MTGNGVHRNQVDTSMAHSNTRATATQSSLALSDVQRQPWKPTDESQRRHLLCATTGASQVSFNGRGRRIVTSAPQPIPSPSVIVIAIVFIVFVVVARLPSCLTTSLIHVEVSLQDPLLKMVGNGGCLGHVPRRNHRRRRIRGGDLGRRGSRDRCHVVRRHRAGGRSPLGSRSERIRPVEPFSVDAVSTGAVAAANVSQRPRTVAHPSSERRVGSGDGRISVLDRALVRIGRGGAGARHALASRRARGERGRLGRRARQSERRDGHATAVLLGVGCRRRGDGAWEAGGRVRPGRRTAEQVGQCLSRGEGRTTVTVTSCRDGRSRGVRVVGRHGEPRDQDAGSTIRWRKRLCLISERPCRLARFRLTDDCRRGDDGSRGCSSLRTSRRRKGRRAGWIE